MHAWAWFLVACEGGRTGNDDSGDLGTSFVKVSRIESDTTWDLLGDRQDAGEGDWALASDAIYALVDDVRLDSSGAPRQRHNAPSGGTLVDLGIAGGADHLKQVYQVLGHDPRVSVRYERLDPGQGGSSLDVRGTVFDPSGTLGLPLANDGSVPQLEVLTTYSAFDGESFVHMSTTITNNGSTAAKPGQICDALVVDGEGGEPFIPSPSWGYDWRDGEEVKAVWLGFTQQGQPGATFGVVSPTSEVLSLRVHDGGDGKPGLVTACGPVPEGSLDRGASIVYERMIIATEGNEPSNVSGIAYPLLSNTRSSRYVEMGLNASAPITGVLSPVDEVALIFWRTDPATFIDATGEVQLGGIVPATATVVHSENGQFNVPLPPGSYEIEVVGQGYNRLRYPVDVQGGSAENALVYLQGSGTHEVIFQTVDAGGDRISEPARVTLLARGGSIDPYVAFAWEDATRVIAGNKLWMRTGQADVELPAGPYRAILSRGPEAPLVKADFVAPLGQSVDLALGVELTVPGHLAFDPAVASIRSVHGAHLVEHVQSAAESEGLDAVALADLGRVSTPIEGTGVAAWSGIGGRFDAGSLTAPMGDGWWSAFPALTEINAGSRRPEDSIGDAYANGAVAITLHHPRGSGEGALHSGFMESHGYNPAVGPAEADFLLREGSSGSRVLDLTGFEVLSPFDPAGTVAALEDWWSLLDAGYAIAPVGSSFAADLRVEVPGVARTYVRAANTDELPSQFAAGRVFATTGPLIEANVLSSAGTVSPGDTINDNDGVVTVNLKVQAQPWVPVTRVRILTNGGRVLRTFDDLSDGTTKLNTSVSVTLEATDRWIVVDAGDPGVLPGGDFAIVSPNVPSYGTTAAMWVEH